MIDEKKRGRNVCTIDCINYKTLLFLKIKSMLLVTSSQGLKMDRDLDSWNPMELDYRNPRINSYREGIGQDLQHRDLSDLER